MKKIITYFSQNYRRIVNEIVIQSLKEGNILTPKSRTPKDMKNPKIPNLQIRANIQISINVCYAKNYLNHIWTPKKL